MARKTNMKHKRLLPVEIPLPEGIDIEGAMFIRLATLSDLQSFWALYKSRYAYAARGCAVRGEQIFLKDFEWIFATTKVGLVKAFTRWEEVGIQCVWYDWANDPESSSSHQQWFSDRDEIRLHALMEKRWTQKDEDAHQRDLLRRTPETYRGWWTLQNLPRDMSDADWLDSQEELIDPGLPLAEVTKYMQEFTYDSFDGTLEEIVLMDADGVDEEIKYWLSEKAEGSDYYGSENE
ncbi:hypothetical protein SAMN05192549_1259 [Duganella sacchari]|uniref:Uncharacterized protein n=1 Tax=Duganella sacchari TaxID=551987 RepID=A0A1M7RFA1_9BURK|nr:hypothetical protein [Duganella sacchari]SHN44718.1 hypothetical protein SAMN05192549_1259 [Duganella sacchari]